MKKYVFVIFCFLVVLMFLLMREPVADRTVIGTLQVSIH